MRLPNGGEGPSFWKRLTGDWRPLVEEPLSTADLSELMHESSVPSFGFYFMPSEGGEMVAEVTDSTGKTYTKKIEVPGRKL